VESAGAAEGQKRYPARVDTGIGRVCANRGCHGLSDDAIDPECGGLDVGLELRGQRFYRFHGAFRIETHLAAEKVLGVQKPENEVCIRYRRLDSASTVTDGTRLRAGALRANGEKPERIHARDAAASRANLDHVDGGNSYGKVASGFESIAPIHFERSCDERATVLDEARFGCGAAHVEGHELIDPSSSAR